MKRIVSLILMITIFSCLIASTDVTASETLCLNSDLLTLYVLDDADKEVISIPDNLDQTFQLEVLNTDSSVYWRVASGDSVTVDQNGTVSVKFTTWYSNGFYMSTQPFDGYTSILTEPELGISVIEAVVGSEVLYATVEVLDYALTYAQNILNDYYINNISDSMTDYEKLEIICYFPSQYDYDVRYYDYVNMILHGGGDCWASTSAINYLCELAGFNYHTRYAALDAGAGSGHRNTAVILDDGVYVLEAGYYETAPRYYNIYKLIEGFSYRWLSDSSLQIYLYDGSEQYLNIPESLNSVEVSSIDSNFIYYNENASNYRVKEVSLPKTISDISPLAFSGCSELSGVYVDEANPNFMDIDGVVFTKDEKTLYSFPSAKSEDYTIPDNTQIVGEYAFYFSNLIKNVTFGNGVTEIGLGAFGDCCLLENVELPESLQKISAYAFYNTPSLKKITIPDSVTYIDDNAFNNAELTILGSVGSVAQTYANEHGFKFIDTNASILYGDVDINGRVNVVDATLVQKYSADLITLSDEALISADVNGDNRINVLDATLIQKKVASIITSFPVEN